jgi:hypothetical protein
MDQTQVINLRGLLRDIHVSLVTIRTAFVPEVTLHVVA